MAKYNVGDKVKVRENIGEIMGAIGIPPMIAFAGEEVTISKVGAVASMSMDTYEIKEDDSPLKYAWSNDMFEDVASTAPKKNPMPELTTGMFGKDEKGDLFVIVNDLIVYQKGTWDWLEDIVDGIVTVDALYKSNCFNRVKDGKAKVIWERDTTETPDDVDEDAFKELSDFLDFLLECAKAKEADKK